MATLHVRNVPVELYERLRTAAEEDRRSIGAEAVVLLRTALSDREVRKRELGRVTRGPSAFKQRFAKSAKALVLRAQELARADGAAEVAPAHVLLAMLEDDVLRPALERGGVTGESVRAALPAPARPGATAPPLSAEARRMVEQALLASLDASV